MGEAPQPTPRAPARRKRTLRRLAAWAVAAALLLAFLALCALWIMPALTDSRAGRAAAARALSGLLRGAHVRIDGLRLAPLRTHLLDVRGLRVAPPDQPDRPVLVLERLDVRWRPSALLRREVHVTSVRAEGARLEVARRGGRWNFMDVLPPFGGEGPFRWEELRLPLSVRVDEARLSGLVLALEVDDLLRGTVGEVSAEGSVRFTRDLDGGFDVRLDAGEAVFEAPGMGLEGRARLRADARVDVRGNAVELAAAAVIAPVRAAADRLGEVGPFDVCLGLDAQADLAEWEVPSAEVDLWVPGTLGSSLSLSLARGRGWEFSGRHMAAADLGAAAGLLHLQLPEALRSAAVDGRLLLVTDLDGELGAPGGPAAYVRLSTRAYGSGVSGRALAGLPDGPPVAASASGLSARLAADVDVLAGPGYGCVALGQADGGLAELEAAWGETAEVVCGPMGGRVTARAALPGAGTADARGWWSVASPTLAWTGLGRVSLPVDVRFAVRASDLLDPSAGPRVSGTVRGTAGDLMPEFALAGSAAANGRRGVSVGGEALVDVGGAVGLLDGLDEGVRGLVGELAATGRWLGGFRLAGGLPSGAGGGLRLQTHEAVLLDGLGLHRQGVDISAGPLAAGLTLSLGVDAAGLPHGFEGLLLARANDLEAGLTAAGSTASASFEEARLRASCAVPGLDLSRPGLAAEAAVEGLEGLVSLGPEGRAFAVPPLDCTLRGRAEADLLAGDLELSDVLLSVSDLLEVAAPSLLVEGLGRDGVGGEFRLDVPDLGGVVEAVAGAVPEVAGRLPELAGRLTAGVRLGGHAPLLERMVHALAAGQGLPRPDVLPLRTFVQRDLPLSVDVEFAMEDVAASYELPSGRGVGASGVGVRGRSRFERGDVDAELALRVPRVDFGSFPLPLEDFEADLTCRARDFDQVELAVSRLSGLGGAVTADGNLRASGLGRLRGVPTPAMLLRSLDVSLEGRGGLRPGALRVPGELSASGALGLDLSAALRAGERIEVAARPRIEGLSLAWGDVVEVSGVEGAVGFSKTWRIWEDEGAGRAALSQGLVASPPAAAAEGLRRAVAEFATAGDGLAGSPEGLSVGSVSVLGSELVRDVRVELSASGSAVRVPRLHMAALGGRLVGAASFAPAEGGRLAQMDGEFSGVDFRRLLPPELRQFSGDSQVNGDFRLSMLVTPEAGAGSPLRDLTARASVTHVGPLALDRLLLALDPKGSRPALSRLRRALVLAGPLRGQATLSRGFVGGSVELRGLAGGLVTEYSLPRFSVMRLFEHELVAGPVRRAAGALRGLDVLDADTIVIAPDGGVGLR